MRDPTEKRAFQQWVRGNRRLPTCYRCLLHKGEAIVKHCSAGLPLQPCLTCEFCRLLNAFFLACSLPCSAVSCPFSLPTSSSILLFMLQAAGH